MFFVFENICLKILTVFFINNKLIHDLISLWVVHKNTYKLHLFSMCYYYIVILQNK